MDETLFDPLINGSLWPLAAVIYLLLWMANEIGFRIGRWSEGRRDHPEREISGIGTVTAGMFALLAFSLGLTISIAQNRFEARRAMVVQEANAIGTAWLRAKVVNAPEGAALVGLIEDYARVRLDYVKATADKELALLARTNAMQSQMWAGFKPLVQREPTPITASLMAALNDMFDASLSSRFALVSKTPQHLPVMLLCGALLAIGAMGFQIGIAGQRPLLLLALMLVMWTGGLLLIVDLNRARVGLIQVDPAPLIWTIQGFAAPAK
jgi:hypothetical protein